MKTLTTKEGGWSALFAPGYGGRLIRLRWNEFDLLRHPEREEKDSLSSAFLCCCLRTGSMPEPSNFRAAVISSRSMNHSAAITCTGWFSIGHGRCEIIPPVPSRSDAVWKGPPVWECRSMWKFNMNFPAGQ